MPDDLYAANRALWDRAADLPRAPWDEAREAQAAAADTDDLWISEGDIQAAERAYELWLDRIGGSA